MLGINRDGTTTSTTGEEHQPLNRTTRQRPRNVTVGGGGSVATTTTTAEYPYRDDPTAPPSVRLESFTPGGYGPLHSHINTPPSPPVNGYYYNQNNNHQYNNHHSSLPNTYHNSDNNNNNNKKTKKGFFFLNTYRQFCYSQPVQYIAGACSCLPCCIPTKGSSFQPIPSSSNDGSGNQNINNNYYYYYLDQFNDLSYSCSVGTSDENGIWLNRNDPAGTIMSCLVWFLIFYSAITMAFVARSGGISNSASFGYTILAILALSAHVKTTLTDPGSVPASAVPTETDRYNANTTTHHQQHHKLSMCSQCQTYKPPGSHHCRICNRCISKMDHHCPWMNNCIGAGNMKHFLLFLIYTWFCSVYSLLFMGYNYFFCATEDCTVNIVLTQLIRIMTLLSIGAFLFTSSMLMNVVYGLMTGIGTIDRLKKKAAGTLLDSDEEYVPLKNVFGLNPIYEWFLPIDPIFEDYDKIMGFATPQRYLREQIRNSTTRTGSNSNHSSSHHHQQQQHAQNHNNTSPNDDPYYYSQQQQQQHQQSYPPPPLHLTPSQSSYSPQQQQGGGGGGYHPSIVTGGGTNSVISRDSHTYTGMVV